MCFLIMGCDSLYGICWVLMWGFSGWKVGGWRIENTHALRFLQYTCLFLGIWEVALVKDVVLWTIDLKLICGQRSIKFV